MSKHEHTRCKDLLGSLSDYVDGALSESLCQEIEAHVAECSNCRIVVDTLRKTVTLYHTTAGETAEVPAQVRERLFRTLNLEDYLKH
ncbi:MAG: zf-HC2 domain-containing protein [Chloroflexi bacterium]|nr:zf-HC2 domain-containing protein [Chloroflexota bacterium]